MCLCVCVCDCMTLRMWECVWCKCVCVSEWMTLCVWECVCACVSVRLWACVSESVCAQVRKNEWSNKRPPEIFLLRLLTYLSVLPKNAVKKSFRVRFLLLCNNAQLKHAKSSQVVSHYKVDCMKLCYYFNYRNNTFSNTTSIGYLIIEWE